MRTLSLMIVQRLGDVVVATAVVMELVGTVVVVAEIATAKALQRG